jgi:hypothetical protein
LRGTYFFHFQGTSWRWKQYIALKYWCPSARLQGIPENRNLNIHCYENLKISHVMHVGSLQDWIIVWEYGGNSIEKSNNYQYSKNISILIWYFVHCLVFRYVTIAK